MISAMNICAWAAAAALALWMLWDMLKTNRSYSETYLTSSAEGEIIDAEVGETAARS
ncbi:hypothetical protein [Hansschlegelia plantiphila]|uniref:Uncharacterized protein n=1 Tax=Hansschlegelia plantiphila TaxID=374655 RepID=A0A9W6IZB6_9HYPH|nr:hypothetical protein [Hansschlegelia plantiphila]GLK66395.1 hypothetical protein GCM10008179_00330 [Hansschlegelia plantiphila]